jgi:mannose-6-phosphate isomerase-like protein (cupin superfamily)
LFAVEGQVIVSIDREGLIRDWIIGPGEAFVVPQGAWHRVRSLKSGRLMFLTPIVGTMVRDRAPTVQELSVLGS